MITGCYTWPHIFPLLGKYKTTDKGCHFCSHFLNGEQEIFLFFFSISPYFYPIILNSILIHFIINFTAFSCFAWIILFLNVRTEVDSSVELTGNTIWSPTAKLTLGFLSPMLYQSKTYLSISPKFCPLLENVPWSHLLEIFSFLTLDVVKTPMLRRHGRQKNIKELMECEE